MKKSYLLSVFIDLYECFRTGSGDNFRFEWKGYR